MGSDSYCVSVHSDEIDRNNSLDGGEWLLSVDTLGKEEFFNFELTSVYTWVDSWFILRSYFF